MTWLWMPLTFKAIPQKVCFTYSPHGPSYHFPLSLFWESFHPPAIVADKICNRANSTSPVFVTASTSSPDPLRLALFSPLSHTVHTTSSHPYRSSLHCVFVAHTILPFFFPSSKDYRYLFCIIGITAGASLLCFCLEPSPPPTFPPTFPRYLSWIYTVYLFLLGDWGRGRALGVNILLEPTTESCCYVYTNKKQARTWHGASSAGTAGWLISICVLEL